METQWSSRIYKKTATRICFPTFTSSKLFGQYTMTSPQDSFSEAKHNNNMLLPFEILAQIASVYPLHTWTFASVCRHWRNATMLYPRCWATIHIKEQLVNGTVPATQSNLDLWTKRSGGSQLEFLVEGSFSPSMLSESHLCSLSRIHTLHLDEWTQDSDLYLKGIMFPNLEILSIGSSIPKYTPQITLKRISTMLLEDSNQAEGENCPRAPRLRALALSRVLVDIPSFPGIDRIDTLKLFNCEFAPSVSLWGFVDQVRLNVETLSLHNTSSKAATPGPYAKNVDYPSLKSLTLVFPETSRYSLPSIIIDGPVLTELTCDDAFLPQLNPQSFPNLSLLSVRSFQSSSLKAFRKVLTEFNLTSLTLFRVPNARCGLNVLLWSMAQSSDLGKTLQHLRYYTTYKENVQTLLKAVNKARGKPASIPGDGFLASQVLVCGDRSNEYSLPWDAELCWAKT